MADLPPTFTVYGSRLSELRTEDLRHLSEMVTVHCDANGMHRLTPAMAALELRNRETRPGLTVKVFFHG